MAKKKAKANKSEAIRQYLRQHRKARPKDVADALNAGGLDVTPATVSQVKHHMKKTKGKKKRVKRKSTAGRSAARTSRRDGKMFDALVEAKKLADRLGGIDRAKEALGMLEKLR